MPLIILGARSASGERTNRCVGLARTVNGLVIGYIGYSSRMQSLNHKIAFFFLLIYFLLPSPYDSIPSIFWFISRSLSCSLLFIFCSSLYLCVFFKNFIRYVIADDDTFLRTAPLRAYLSLLNPDEPQMVSHTLHVVDEDVGSSFSVRYLFIRASTTYSLFFQHWTSFYSDFNGFSPTQTLLLLLLPCADLSFSAFFILGHSLISRSFFCIASYSSILF